MIRNAFPIAQAVLCAGAAVVYAMGGDWRRAVYWVCAVTITIVLTF